MKNFALVLALAMFGCSNYAFEVADDDGLGGAGPVVASDGAPASTGGVTDGSGGASESTGGVTAAGGSTGGTDSSSGGTDGTGGATTTGGTGGSDGVDPVCSPGESRCSGLDIEVCSAEGQWGHSQTCAFFCDEGQAEAQCTGVCSPGEKDCSEAGNTQTCDATGQWKTTEACEHVCSAGSCTGSCTPGAKQCAGGSTQTCTDAGVWETTETCDHVCSAGSCTGVCSPGVTECHEGGTRTCDATGQWIVGSQCPSVCSAGSCTGVCEPGSKKCDGTGTRTCNSSGQWDAVVACPAGANETASCSGQGECGKTCNEGYADCTGASGCESALDSLETCGSCDVACDPYPNNASPICTEIGCDFVCDDGWGDVNGLPGDGCEADTNNDPENCGEVGKSCYGGSCSVGVCEFEGIEEVASFDAATYGNVSAIDEDGGYLFVFTSGKYILKAKSDGSTGFSVLVSNVEYYSAGNLIAENGQVFWVEDKDGDRIKNTGDGIYMVSASGGTPVRLHTDIPHRLEVDGGYVYWSNGILDPQKRCDCPDQRNVYRVSTSGGARETVYTFQAGSLHSQVRVENSFLYVGLYATATTARVYALDLTDTTEFSQLINFEGNLWGFDVLGGTAYAVGGYGTLKRGSWGANEATLNSSISPGAISNFELAADNSFVYLRHNKALARVGVNGGTLTSLSPDHNIVDLSQDNSYVYWGTNTDLGDGRTYVLKVAKP